MATKIMINALREGDPPRSNPSSHDKSKNQGKLGMGRKGEDLAEDGRRKERNLSGTKEIAGRRGSRVYGWGGGGVPSSGD
jgi:hypothetical protein